MLRSLWIHMMWKNDECRLKGHPRKAWLGVSSLKFWPTVRGYKQRTKIMGQSWCMWKMAVFIRMCCRWKDVSVGTNARELFNKHINYLSSATCHQLVLHTVGKIDEMFHDSLKPRVDSGVTRAVGTANATVDKWGAKVSSTAICAQCFNEAVS